MIGVELVASTRETGTTLLTKWKDTISGFYVPGRFAFFVFRIRINYCADDFFPGLQIQLVNDGYYVGGTLDEWDKACLAMLNNKSPEDCCMIYRQVFNKLTTEGYRLSGKKSSAYGKFYIS